MAITTETPRSGSPALARDAGPMDLDMAHELKNALTAVKALVQLGSRNPAEAASHARLALVDREVTRMQETLRRCLPSGEGDPDLRGGGVLRPAPAARGPRPAGGGLP